MRTYRDASIKRKLTLITLLTSSATLLLAGASYVTYDLTIFRRDMTRDLSTLTEIIGANSAAALAFSDQRFASEVLASLNAKHNIMAAYLYKKDGSFFAKFDRTGAGSEARAPGADQPRRSPQPNRLAVSRPIVFDGEAIGTILIESDLQDFYARLERYASIGALVLLVAMAAGFVLSSKLQRPISEPILHLAETAKVISEKKDYSIRAAKYNRDELGLLIDG